MTIDKMMASLRKSNPKSKLTTLSDPDALSKVREFIPTGCLPLDLIMGGGMPVGRLTEIYGDTSTGKSLLAAHILAETQAAGGVGVLIDTETATSDDIMAAVGIDPSQLVYACPETIEEVYDCLMQVIEARAEAAQNSLMTIVWDSVASTSSDAEIEKVKKEGLGGSTMATHARLISMICRIIPRLVSQQRIAMVFINQLRDKIGVVYGEKETTFGGRAIPYWSTSRLKMTKIKTLTDSKQTPTGIAVRCQVTKSKVCPPFGSCEFPIKFGVGIDKPGAILYWLKDRKLAVTAGSFTKMIIPSSGEIIKFNSATWSHQYQAHQQEIDNILITSAGYETSEESCDEETD